MRSSEYWDMLPREMLESPVLEIFKILLVKALDKALLSTEGWSTCFLEVPFNIDLCVIVFSLKSNVLVLVKMF